MADGQCEGVGGVGGLRRVGQMKQSGDHGGHLLFVGPSRSGDGSLDLTRGVQGNGAAVTCCDQHGNSGRLRRSHHGAHVVLGEHPFHRHRIRRERPDERVHGLLQCEESTLRGVTGRSADDIDVHERELTTGIALNNADTAPGQPGVNGQHAHASTLPAPVTATRKGARRSQSIAASAASLTWDQSAFVCTFCTSSQSSRASMSRPRMGALASSSGTWTLGHHVDSAES